jgi:hypothetical protein
MKFLKKKYRKKLADKIINKILILSMGMELSMLSINPNCREKITIIMGKIIIIIDNNHI